MKSKNNEIELSFEPTKIIEEKVDYDFLVNKILSEKTEIFLLRGETFYLREGKKIPLDKVKNNIRIKTYEAFDKLIETKEIKSLMAFGHNTGKIIYKDKSELIIDFDKNTKRIFIKYTRRKR